jgi:glycosyltransferase involved in cell wall biosynthesis
VVIPYGGDAFVYRNIRSTSVMHALMISYPKAARAQDAIQRRVSYWCKQADCVISGFVGPDGFGRWDVLLPNPLQIDTETWKPTKRLSFADGVNDVVYVAHAPNHRGFKGTEFVLSAIEALKEEGLLVELILMEKMQNDELRRRLECDVDILVDQLIFTGHGLNALEGLASCLPVIANLEDESYILPMRRWSYFGECPIVSASPETLVNVLRKLVTRPQLRHQLGCAGRQYVEKYHGYDSAQYLFGNVLKYIYGEVDSIINLYHPLLGEYPKRKARIVHPLVDNHIVD